MPRAIACGLLNESGAVSPLVNGGPDDPAIAVSTEPFMFLQSSETFGNLGADLNPLSVPDVVITSFELEPGNSACWHVRSRGYHVADLTRLFQSGDAVVGELMNPAGNGSSTWIGER
jgi:hypothetical protein